MRKKKIHGGCTLWARQTIESEIFGKPAKWFKIWFYLVSRANHTENGGLRRGQCHLTYETIMLKCGATKGEVDHSIRWFKARRMLATARATRGFIVTILNYELYQSMDTYKSDSSGDSKATQKRHDKQECNNEDKCKKKSLLHLQVFNHWNSYSNRSVSKQSKEGKCTRVTWRGHKLQADGSVPPDKEEAIGQALAAGYAPEQIIAAIDNYATILLREDFWWTYAWNLQKFLSVGEERHRGAPRKWLRFLPDNFIEENYLTEAARRKREALEQGPRPYELAKVRSEQGRSKDEQRQTA